MSVIIGLVIVGAIGEGVILNHAPVDPMMAVLLTIAWLAVIAGAAWNAHNAEAEP